MELSIVIVNWKSRDYLRKCVASIYAGTNGIEFEIVVIDSASFDGAGEMLAKEFPEVRFIQSTENLGFSKANNRAFESASGRVILFLNPDTEVAGDAIIRMFKAISALPDAGAMGCKLLNTDGSIQTSCVQAYPTILNQVLSADVFRRLTPRSSLWGMKAIFDANPTPQVVEMISGACLMMRRDVFERIGRFSTEYFMYAEDVDLCFKAQRAGFKNYYFNDAEVVHHGGGSSQQARSNFSSIMMIESISQFLKKYRGGFYSLTYRLVTGIFGFMRVIVLLLLSPLIVLKNGFSRWSGACSKWWAVFRWGFGLSRWAKKFSTN